MSTLLQQLAKESFRAGRPFTELINELVEAEYNRTLSKAKTLIRNGEEIEVVRDALVTDGLQFKTALSLVFAAQEQVATEIANEAQLRKATESAQTLFKNGCRFAVVVSQLKAEGCSPELADRVAKENQHAQR